MQTNPAPIVNTFIKIQNETIRVDRIVRYRQITGTIGTMLGKGMIKVSLINGEELMFTYPTKTEAQAEITRLDNALVSDGRTVV
jgi:translation initiation factor IF-1